MHRGFAIDDNTLRQENLETANDATEARVTGRISPGPAESAVSESRRETVCGAFARHATANNANSVGLAPALHGFGAPHSSGELVPIELPQGLSAAYATEPLMAA